MQLVKWIERRATVLLAAASSLCAGENPPRVTLNLHQSISVALAQLPYQVPVKCDAGGNIYIRLYQDPDPRVAPISKIGRDGKLLATFSFAQLSDHGFRSEGLHVSDFVVGNGGEIYALVTNQGQQYFVKFSSDGKFQSATPLSTDKDLHAYRLAGRSPDGFLMNALQGKADDQQPVNLVLDQYGVITRIVSSKESFGTGKSSQDDIQSFELSDVVVDEAGNLYTLRASTPPAILVHSLKGEFLRKFDIDLPGAGYSVVTLAANGGRIAIVFVQGRDQHRSNSRQLFRVIDEGTGAALADYILPPEATGGFACYEAPARFSLLATGGDGRFRLQTVSEP